MPTELNIHITDTPATANSSSLFHSLYSDYVMAENTDKSSKKSRIIVRYGNEYFVLPAIQIMMFFTVNKTVFCIHNNLRKYIVEGATLNYLMNQLPNQIFFRANRQVIINIQFIHSFKPFDNGRIQVNMKQDIYEPIIVSQENATEFKVWIGYK